MRISKLIAELEQVRQEHGDLFVTLYTDRHWQRVGELSVHPARRPYLDAAGERLEHSDKVVELGP